MGEEMSLSHFKKELIEAWKKKEKGDLKKGEGINPDFMSWIAENYYKVWLSKREIMEKVRSMNQQVDAFLGVKPVDKEKILSAFDGEGQIEERVKDYLALLERKEVVSEQLKELNKTLSAVESRLAEQMLEAGIDKITVDDFTVSPKEQDNFSLSEEFPFKNWDDTDDNDTNPFFDWLASIGEAGLIKQKKSVHAQTRKAFLSRYIQDNKPLPNFMKHEVYWTVNKRKA